MLRAACNHCQDASGSSKERDIEARTAPPSPHSSDSLYTGICFIFGKNKLTSIAAYWTSMFAPALVAEYTPTVLALALALMPNAELLTMIDPLSPDLAMAGICVHNARESRLEEGEQEGIRHATSLMDRRFRTLNSERLMSLAVGTADGYTRGTKIRKSPPTGTPKNEGRAQLTKLV